MVGIDIWGIGAGENWKAGLAGLLVGIHAAWGGTALAQAVDEVPVVSDDFRLRGTANAWASAPGTGNGELTAPVVAPFAWDNRRVQAVESGVVRSEPEDPFLPVGFRAGTWTVFTRLEQAIGFATNASNSAGGAPGGYSVTEGSVSMESNWSRHQARIEGNVIYRRPFDTELPEPEVDFSSELRLDLVDGNALAFEAGYDYATEETGSDELPDNVIGRPGVHSGRAAISLARTGGKLDLTLRGSLDRTIYEDARLSGGGSLDQSDRNNNLYSASARLAYGATPAIRPFAEGGIGWRKHDLEFDRNGEARNAIRQKYRAGIEFDLSEKLTGELAIGYLQEDFDDNALQTLRTPTLGADIVWSPERETSVRLATSTEFEISTIAGESGAKIQTFEFSYDRRIRDDLAFNANAALEANLPGSDGASGFSWSTGLGLEYFVTRHLSFTADLDYMRDGAQDPGESWESTEFRLGVALQR